MMMRLYLLNIKLNTDPNPNCGGFSE